MTVTGTVLVDLRDVSRNRLRHRADALRQAPNGARAVVVVGALAVEPEAVRVLREHVDRLELVDVQGEARAVRQWLDALRAGDTLPLGATV